MVQDSDLYWLDGVAATDFGNDIIGTKTNFINPPPTPRHVYQSEDGEEETAITLSGIGASFYYGSKNGVDPDGPGGPGPAFGFGTDSQQWDAYGVHPAWENYIAGVGANLDGESGPAPAGVIQPPDGSTGLQFDVSLTAAGPSSTFNFTLNTTYGSYTPLGAVADCEWDCDGSNDGNANVSDLLSLLGDWDITSPIGCTGGSCDYNNDGCVDVVDLLKLLGNYATDPSGIGCPN